MKTQPQQQPSNDRQEYPSIIDGDDADDHGIGSVDPTAVDTLLAEELRRMSIGDRGIIEEEIHGVRSMEVDETPDVVQAALLAFEREIDSADERLKFAYMEGLLLNGGAINNFPAADAAGGGGEDCGYILCPDFKLRFLRADRFVVRTAVHRYLSYLNLLLRMFGPNALQRPLRHSDLDKDQHDLLKGGHLQLLPSRDRAGRLVLILQRTKSMPAVTAYCRVKMALYIFSVISEDVDTQRKGLVFILSAQSAPEDSLLHDKDVWKEHKAFNEAMPVRFTAIHICLPDGPAHHLFKALFVVVTPPTSRARIRVHQGLTTETQYRLMTFGINVEDLPVTSGGTIKAKYWKQWIETRKAIDGIRIQAQHRGQCVNGGMSAFDGIVHPNTDDVLSSMGGNPKNWGNIELQHLLATLLPSYSKASRQERREMRSEIVRTVHERGGRFLAWHSTAESSGGSGGKNGTGNGGGAGWWVEVTDDVALQERVATSMYDYSRRAGKSGNKDKVGGLPVADPTNKRTTKRRKVDNYEDTAYTFINDGPRIGGTCDIGGCLL